MLSELLNYAKNLLVAFSIASFLLGLLYFLIQKFSKKFNPYSLLRIIKLSMCFSLSIITLIVVAFLVVFVILSMKESRPWGVYFV